MPLVPKKYIISGKNIAYQVWEIFILILAIYIAIESPIKISLKPAIFHESYAIIGFGMFVDIVFVFDVILSFFVSYTDK